MLATHTWELFAQNTFNLHIFDLKDNTDANQTSSMSPQYTNCSGIYETRKLRQIRPSLRAKSSEKKPICPLSLDTIPVSHSASSLIMTFKPETSLPNIGNGCFIDIPQQSDRSFYPQNMAISQFSFEGKIYFHFFKRTHRAIKTQ